MKAHTQDFKNQLKSLGKELDAIITIDGTELTAEHINSANLHYEGNILKSVMKQLDLVLDQEIAKGVLFNFKFGVKVNDAYEYLDYGTFIVKDVEKQEDTNTYKITCYDKMLYSMKDYEALDITYPISVRDYIKALCTKLGLGFKNENNTFANYDKMIQQELYLNSDGNSLGYKYRDVFDELAQATASTICIDENDEVEIRYVDDVINETQSAEGTDIVLTDSEEAPLQGFEVKGNTEQDGTPTPSSPIPINVVSGDNTINICGKNLFNNVLSNSIALARTTITYDNEQIVMNTTGADAYFGNIVNVGGTWSEANGQLINVEPNTSYTLSITSNTIDKNFITYYDENKKSIKVDFNVPYQRTFTTPNNTKYISIRIGIANSTSGGVYKFNVMLNKGSSALTYEPYKGNTYEINLGKNLYNPIQGTSSKNNTTLTIQDDVINFKNTGTTNSVAYGIDTELRNANYGNYISWRNMILPAGTYTLSQFYVSGSTTTGTTGSNFLRVDIYYRDVGSTERLNDRLGNVFVGTSNTSTNFTITEPKEINIVVYLYASNATIDINFKVQLEKSDTPTTYSPYFTPIELNKIGTYQDEIFRNENLLDYKATPTTYNCTYQYTNGGIRIITNGEDYDEGLSIPASGLVVGQKYYARINITSMTPSGENNVIYCGISNATYSQSMDTNVPAEMYMEFTPTQENVGFGIYTDAYPITSMDFTIKDLYIGRVNEYIPYGEKGNWYLHKEIYKTTLRGGSETWNLFFSTNGVFIHPINSIPSVNNATTINCFMNYYSNTYSRSYIRSHLSDIDNACATNGNEMIIANKSISSVDDFKTWLSNNNVIVYYVLATPTDTKITNDNYPELLSQLKALDKAQTLEGYTSITSSFPLLLSYVSEYEAIDEEFIKNTRASFEETYGPINSIVLSRSADSDNVFIQDEASIEENGLTELKISDNQIMNFNDRSDYLQDILDKLDGLTYNTNDFESIGITYLELCDRYRVKIRDKKYKCIMFNDEIEVKSGLNEIIYTDMPQETQTDYSKADKTDRKINQTNLIVNKQEGIIESLVEKVVDVSNTISGTGSITLENAHAGNLHYLSIKGNISQLFPNDNTKPSNTRYPIGPTLLIDDTEYILDLDRLRYVNNTLCDEFVYKDGECYIIRRLDSNNQALAEEVIEEREDIILQVGYASTISLKNFSNAIFKCEYLLENVYTDNFASQVDVKSSIIQTENMIAQKVESVADENGNITSGSIILAINKDESQATLSADKIKLEGYTTINDGFSVDLEGNMTAKSGNVGGWKLNDEGLTNNNQFIHNNGYSNIYTYADMVIMRNYLLGRIDLTETDIKQHYDLNGDGVVDSVDLVIMRKMILNKDEGDE